MKSKAQMGNMSTLPHFSGELHFVIESFDIDLTFGFWHLSLI